MNETAVKVTIDRKLSYLLVLDSALSGLCRCKIMEIIQRFSLIFVRISIQICCFSHPVAIIYESGVILIVIV